MRKLLSLLIVSVLTGTVAMPVNAAETKGSAIAIESNLNNEPINYGKPISETEYVDEDGAEVTEKIYFVPAKPTNPTSNTIMAFGLKKATLSGEGWYKKEKVQKWDSNRTTVYWVKGYFVWGNGKSELKKPQYHISNNGINVKITQRKETKTSNSLKLSFSASTRYGRTQKFSVSLKVDSKGKAS